MVPLQQRDDGKPNAEEGPQRRAELRTLRHAESDSQVSEICREYAISEEATFYIRKKKYSGLGSSELRELRDENGKLKRLVADFSLDPHILQEIDHKS